MVVPCVLAVSAMARPVSVLELTAEEEDELQRRVRAATTSARDLVRARIVLLAKGVKQTAVARELGIATSSVNKWSQRFERQGLKGWWIVRVGGQGEHFACLRGSRCEAASQRRSHLARTRSQAAPQVFKLSNDPSSRPSSGTWWGCTWSWSCAATRRRRSRRWNASCRWASATFAPKRTLPPARDHAVCGGTTSTAS